MKVDVLSLVDSKRAAVSIKDQHPGSDADGMIIFTRFHTSDAHFASQEDLLITVERTLPF